MQLLGLLRGLLGVTTHAPTTHPAGREPTHPSRCIPTTACTTRVCTVRVAAALRAGTKRGTRRDTPSPSSPTGRPTSCSGGASHRCRARHHVRPGRVWGGHVLSHSTGQGAPRTWVAPDACPRATTQEPVSCHLRLGSRVATHGIAHHASPWLLTLPKGARGTRVPTSVAPRTRAAPGHGRVSQGGTSWVPRTTLVGGAGVPSRAGVPRPRNHLPCTTTASPSLRRGPWVATTGCIGSRVPWHSTRAARHTGQAVGSAGTGRGGPAPHTSVISGIASGVGARVRGWSIGAGSCKGRGSTRGISRRSGSSHNAGWQEHTRAGHGAAGWRVPGGQ